MTGEEKLTRLDRMRYTKDKLSANLVLLAIVLDVLYFVSIFESDVGSYYYNWTIGASVVYNLIFLLMAFLASEGVKNRQNGYLLHLLVLGVMQFVRIFYLPAKASVAFIVVAGEELQVMSQAQYLYVVACLALSGVCCLAAAVSSTVNNATLARYLRTLGNQTV